ncbi:2-C-methyl-D-erythritol 4-phosphate cytidylyltransferase [Utexia brackfieldae]|uniref:2-C-methyl-D-erythritol 4-phosphate cytidylyltransferase n=1 Tax=Utexia brackfieldae TaxID=3074108 RepID=UPI00370D7041
MIRKPSIVAVVPAAGFGTRMNSAQPKQYLKIGHKTIIEHTLDKLLTCEAISRVIVAVSAKDPIFASLTVAQDSRVQQVIGGDNRADSVLAGLNYVADDEWALVHDAARPCITHEDIHKLIDQVFAVGRGGILAMPIFDTVKLASAAHQQVIDKTLDRNYLWAAATPQLFTASELKASLTKALTEHANITDEASAIEYCGGHPLLVLGRRDNLKVTRPEDLALATFYLAQQQIITLPTDKDKECE